MLLAGSVRDAAAAQLQVIGCGCDSARWERHESIASVASEHLRPEGPFRVDLRRNLSSSLKYSIF